MRREYMPKTETGTYPIFNSAIIKIRVLLSLLIKQQNIMNSSMIQKHVAN